MKRVRFLLLIGSLFFLGCAPSTYPAHKSASNILQSAQGRHIINNLPLNHKVSIEGYSSRFNNGLLEIQVNLQNHKQQPYDLEYKIQWLDKDGFEVESTPWLPLTINAKELRSIKAIAHSPKVEDFKFYIRIKQ